MSDAVETVARNLARLDAELAARGDAPALTVKLVDGLHLTAREKEMILYAHRNNKAPQVSTSQMSMQIDWSREPHTVKTTKREKDDFGNTISRTFTASFLIKE